MRFEESAKLRGDPSDVWKRTSAVRDIPKYWHGTRSLELVEERPGLARVKVRFAFGGSGEAVVTSDDSRRTLSIEYLSGPFTGRQTVTVNDDLIVAAWDVRFRGAYRLAVWNEGHFRSGTVHALERLASGQETPQPGR